MYEKERKTRKYILIMELLTLSLPPPTQNNVHTQKTYRIKIRRLKLANI